MSKQENFNGGIGFFGLLTIALIVLKLTDVISTSWWWVLAPIWIPFVTVIVVGFILFLIVLNNYKN